MNHRTKKFYIETRDGLDMIFHDDIESARAEFNDNPRNKQLDRTAIKIWEVK